MAKYLSGLLLAVALMVWVLRDADLSEIGRQLLAASPAAAAACLVLNFGHNVFRVWRWRALLAPFGSTVRFRTAFAAVIIGYMTTWTIPGRLGELVRPLLLSHREGISFGPCLGTVVADRLLDAGAIVALFAMGSWTTRLDGTAGDHTALLRSGSLVLAGGVVAGIATMLIVASSRERLERWLSTRASSLRWIGRTLLALADGAVALRRPRLALAILAHSFLAWFVIAAATWFGVQAVGARVSFGGVLLILPMLTLGVAVPTPGGAGSYHGAMKVGLLALGVSEPVAVSAGLLVHALITLPVILAGAVLLRTESVSWRDLLAAATAFRRLGAPAAEKPS